MPTVTNRGDDRIEVPSLDLRLDAGASAEVSDEAATALAEHPILAVETPKAADKAPRKESD